MPQVSITQLPQAEALSGTESVPIVQNGVTVQTTTGAISGAGALNYPFLTVGSTVGLTDARQIAAGTGLSLTDNGAGSTLQVNLTGAALSLDSSPVGLQAKTGPNTLTARQIAVGGGMTVLNADGVSGDPTIGLDVNLQNLASLSGIGLMTISGSTFGQTTLLGTANQVSVANGDASGGNPTISLASNPILPGTGGVQIPSGTSGQRIDADGELRYNTTNARFEGYQGGTWINLGVGDGTVTSVSGTAHEITVSSPTTTPVISLAVNPTLPGTGSMVLPQGTTAERSALTYGALRYNTQTDVLEAYTQSIGWGAIVTGTGVTTFSAGSTGFTPATSTSGGIVLGGTLNPSSGGTGATTLTGYVKGNGTSAFTASSTIPTSDLSGTISNAQLANSAVTYNGVSVSLGGSGTISATTTNPLTSGTGLQYNSGTTFDGSAAKTISIDSSVATLTGTQILTNKTISGLDNTLTNIGNTSLVNSAVTINGSSVSLGGSVTVTATATNALTIGTGLSGTSYNGSAPVTIAIDSTVATLSGVQTLTNKSISGSTNTLTNIPNSALTNSSLTIGSTSVSLGGTTTTLAGLTSITLTQDPTADLQVATKQYVDSIASGLNYHQPVNYASTAALPSYTYSNGISGVGATITANANGALSFGGGSPTATQRLLVKDEAGANAPYNGIYTVTQAGSLLTPFILTRATDYDTSGSGTNEIDAGDYVLVLSGTNASTAWVQQTPLPIVVGTTDIVFLQFNAPITYTAGTGLNLSPATTFNISNTGVTAATYGSASSVPTIAVNAQGQITSASNTSIAINGNQITSGTVGVTYGGTGLSGGTSGGIPYFSSSTTIASSSALAANALVIGGGAGVAPSTTTTGTGVLTALGTNVGTAGAFVVNGGALGTPSSGTVTNLTGTASININGTVGATTPTTGAFTTVSASGVITSTVATGTAPFTVASTTQVANLNAATAGTATNATNVAVTSNSTNATNYLTFVSATSGNLPELVNSSITCNPSTGKITGGISGGTF